MDPNAQPTPPAQQVNIGTVAEGSMGLTGWWKIAGNATAMALIAGSFLYLQHQLVSQNREDRHDDRQLFRESLQSIQTEENRRAGEIKGSMDSLNSATNALSKEINGWRQDIRDKKGASPP